MKKIIFSIATVLSCGLLASCGTAGNTGNTTQNNGTAELLGAVAGNIIAGQTGINGNTVANAGNILGNSAVVSALISLLLSAHGLMRSHVFSLRVKASLLRLVALFLPIKWRKSLSHIIRSWASRQATVSMSLRRTTP